MKIIYSNKKTEKQCSSLKEATNLFGGDRRLATSLMARINAIEQADVMKDIIAAARIVEIREVSAHYE